MEAAVFNRGPKWLQRLHDWRVEHVSDRMFILVLALLVGFFAAVAAFSLHWIINQIVMLLTSSFEKSRANWLYLVYPVVESILLLFLSGISSRIISLMASRVFCMPYLPTSHVLSLIIRGHPSLPRLLPSALVARWEQRHRLC